jgi:hypothetical protein
MIVPASVVDPDSLNRDPDSAFQVNPDPLRIRFRIRNQGFGDKKLEEKNTAEIGLLKGRPSHRRSLHSVLKREHPDEIYQHFLFY